MVDVILDIEDLKISFDTKYGEIEVINNVNFKLKQGEKLGIVGESGSGKTVVSKSILQLLDRKTCNISGKINYLGENLLNKSEKEMYDVRGKQIAMIFQEPMTSLNPVYSIGNQLIETIRVHQNIGKKEAKIRAIEMLRLVGISSPETRLRQFPFQFSGGMRQRVMIAMALSCNPNILIADEPTTALDVTIQSQILELMKELNEKFSTSIILITHDLGVVAEMVDTVIVMYAGNFVEYGDVSSIFENPLHPYTRGLLNSIPKIHGEKTKLEPIEGVVPSIDNFPIGCKFSTRCKFKKPKCENCVPPLVKLSNRMVRCWKYVKEGYENE